MDRSYFLMRVHIVYFHNPAYILECAIKPDKFAFLGKTRDNGQDSHKRKQIAQKTHCDFTIVDDVFKNIIRCHLKIYLQIYLSD